VSIDELDEKTRAIIRRLAEEHECTVEEFVRAVLRSESSNTENGDPILGIFSDEPDLMDKVVESAYEAREHPLRHSER
jgi:hypothetical protein